ncbi:Rieske (2Fe-2S) protein [Variovorax sp. M-6]|uniref:Rieske (2Fe-2S) protein n=1 Tax=Variovorax sp. M-6 TaxID=3233041 RepID=UPI003F9E751A
MPNPTVEYRNLGPSARLPDQSVNPYYVADRKLRVSVARVGKSLFAFDDLCPHDGCQLSAGILSGTTLMCPCDGSRFDVSTGAVQRGPSTRPLPTYEVREQDGEISVRV